MLHLCISSHVTVRWVKYSMWTHREAALFCCPSGIYQSQSYIITKGLPVNESVRLGVEFRPDFGCSQDNCGFVMGHPPNPEDGSVL
jgi:hypothetical protein